MVGVSRSAALGPVEGGARPILPAPPRPLDMLRVGWSLRKCAIVRAVVLSFTLLLMARLGWCR